MRGVTVIARGARFCREPPVPAWAIVVPSAPIIAPAELGFSIDERCWPVRNVTRRRVESQRHRPVRREGEFMAAADSHGEVQNGGLRANALGAAGIVFLVMAAVAPLPGVIVVAGLAITLGNGGGTPASFLIVALILLLFSVGYAQMSKKLVSAGGFYAFVVRGLGRTGGLVA